MQGYSQVGKAPDFGSVIVGSTPATPANFADLPCVETVPRNVIYVLRMISYIN